MKPVIYLVIFDRTLFVKMTGKKRHVCVQEGTEQKGDMINKTLSYSPYQNMHFVQTNFAS